LEIVGHNIANVNTAGFKSQRAVFSDLLYETMRPASSASDGGLGGTNPSQIGLGVKLAQADRKFSQGSLEATGEQFDLAISGDGFFVLSDGKSDYFTRAGNFSLDEQGLLVSSGGMRATRVAGIGEPDGVYPGFQVPGETVVRVPLGMPLPGVATAEASVTGNLSANLTPPLQTVMTSRAPMTTAGNVPATGATTLTHSFRTTPPTRPGTRS
jgi:flagellar hook protein FlgE